MGGGGEGGGGRGGDGGGCGGGGNGEGGGIDGAGEGLGGSGGDEGGSEGRSIVPPSSSDAKTSGSKRLIISRIGMMVLSKEAGFCKMSRRAERQRCRGLVEEAAGKKQRWRR